MLPRRAPAQRHLARRHSLSILWARLCGSCCGRQSCWQLLSGGGRCRRHLAPDCHRRTPVGLQVSCCCEHEPRVLPHHQILSMSQSLAGCMQAVVHSVGSHQTNGGLRCRCMTTALRLPRQVPGSSLPCPTGCQPMRVLHQWIQAAAEFRHVIYSFAGSEAGPNQSSESIDLQPSTCSEPRIRTPRLMSVGRAIQSSSSESAGK